MQVTLIRLFFWLWMSLGAKVLLILAKLNCVDYWGIMNYRTEKKDKRQEERTLVTWTPSLAVSPLWKFVYRVLGLMPLFYRWKHICIKSAGVQAVLLSG